MNSKTKFWKMCILIPIAMLFFTVRAIAASDAEQEKYAPKSIEDIVQLIKQANSDKQSPDADLKILNEKPPENISKQEKYSFYYLQAQAAERLGQIEKRIQLLKLALENARELTHQEFVTVRELAISELKVGYSKDAIQRLNSQLDRVPQNKLGQYLKASALLSSAYAQIGDFEESKKYLRLADASLAAIRRYPSYSKYGNSWNRTYLMASGELSFFKGEFQEAELAFRKTSQLQSMELTLDDSKVLELSKGFVAGLGDDENVQNPNTVMESLEYTYIRLSESLIRIRKINEAEYYAREALKRSIRRTGKSSVATSNALRNLAILMLNKDRNKDALYLLNQSMLSLKEAGVTEDSIQLAQTKKTLASALIANEQYDAALKIYTELDELKRTHPDTGRFVDLVTPDRVFALSRMGDWIRAEQFGRELLSLNESRIGKLSKEATQARLLLAMVLAEQRKDDAARSLFSTAINELIEQEHEVSSDSDGISSKEKRFLTSYVETYLGVLSRLYDKTPNTDLIKESFVLGDLARSSSVQRALSASTARANIADPWLLKMVREEQDLNQQIVFLTRFSKELAMQPASEQLPAVQTKIKQDIEVLRKQAKRAAQLIALDFPEYAELVSPKPTTLDKIQKQIKSNETLVTWFVGTKTTYVWAVNSQGAPLFKSVAMGQAEVRKNVVQLRKALDPGASTIEDIPPFDFSLASKLYDALFKPVQSALAGKDTLVVVPHDEIGQLPLAVLTTGPFQLKGTPEKRFSNYKDAPWLIRQYAIVSAPSATALSALRGLPEPRKGRVDFIGFGDPLFSVEQAKLVESQPVANVAGANQLASRGMPLRLRNSPNTAGVSSAEVSLLPRLPDTNEEIVEISKVFNVDPQRDIFLQKRANLDEVLKTDLSNRKVVMFSTHGLVPGELDGLTQPALALTNPEVRNEKGDGLLKVDAILTLKLDADWVVLSACNTAAGEGEGAEALSGLGRAFFFAGARAILVSSWPVDSEASRKLMTDLFKRYTQDKSKPQALQQASLQLMNNGMPDDAKARYTYAHPLFWAPFTMVGN